VCVFRSSTELSITQEWLWSCCDDETGSAFMIQKNLHLLHLHELGRRRQSSSRLKVWILGFLACLFACMLAAAKGNVLYDLLGLDLCFLQTQIIVENQTAVRRKKEDGHYHVINISIISVTLSLPLECC
jgi:uncharacterized membrane protein HdeD (DUF308 family)